MDIQPPYNPSSNNGPRQERSYQNYNRRVPVPTGWETARTYPQREETHQDHLLGMLTTGNPMNGNTQGEEEDDGGWGDDYTDPAIRLRERNKQKAAHRKNETGDHQTERDPKHRTYEESQQQTQQTDFNASLRQRDSIPADSFQPVPSVESSAAQKALSAAHHSRGGAQIPVNTSTNPGQPHRNANNRGNLENSASIRSSTVDWAANDSQDRLRQWQTGINPISSAQLPPTPPLEPIKPSSDLGSPRSGSDNESLPPVIAYYSEGEESVPDLIPDISRSTVAGEDESLKDSHHTLERAKSQIPPVVATNVPPLRDLNPSRQNTSQTGFEEHRGLTDGRDIHSRLHSPTRSSFSIDHQRRGKKGYPGGEGKWWKRDPHPVYSARFASRRLLIEFPCSIRRDFINQTMIDHFSRYGTVKNVTPYEGQGNSCEKAFVVFEEPESVQKVFDDPKRAECLFRSSPHHLPTTLDIGIKTVDPRETYRTIWIRLTGPRFDARSRSASPHRYRSDEAHQPDSTINWAEEQNNIGNGGRYDMNMDMTKSPLPSSVVIDAVPQRNRYGSVVYWPRVRPASERNIGLRDAAAVRDTGKKVVWIGEVDLKRRVAERDIIPKLCDYFADIAEIFPPTEIGQGWQICVDGPLSARHLLEQIQKISGITARWAHEGDGWYSTDRQSVPDDEVKDQLSPVSRLNKELDGYPSLPSRRRADTPHITKDNVITVDPQLQPGVGIENPQEVKSEHDDPFLDDEPAIHSNPSSVTISPSPQTPRASQHKTPPKYPSIWTNLEPDLKYPNLRRTLVHTYRGRPLKEEISPTGEVRYIDERAIFVGRLVKEKETLRSLFQRFSRYGSVCSIEYNPSAAHTTYATARVLYQDQESVARAIQHEDESVSEGSAMKVEVRRVLPLDVQTREMYIDTYGRAVSPSMASQYSSPALTQFTGPKEYIPPPTLPPSMGTYMPPMPTGQPWIPVQPYNGTASQMAVPANGYGPMPLQMPMYPGQMWMPYQVRPPTPPPDSVGANNGQMGQMGQGAPQGVYPQILYAMGIGYQPHPSQAQPMSYIPPYWGIPPTPVYPTLATLPATSLPTHNFQTPVPPQTPSHSTKDAGITLSIPEMLNDKDKKKSPTVLATKMEDGVLKVIYDPQELKVYKEENGIEDKRPIDEIMELLPLSTGGHDPNTSRLSRSSKAVPDDGDKQTKQSGKQEKDNDTVSSPITADILRQRFDGREDNSKMSLGDQIEMEERIRRVSLVDNHERGRTRIRAGDQEEYSVGGSLSRIPTRESQRRASVGPGIVSQHSTLEMNHLVPLPIPSLPRLPPASPRGETYTVSNQVPPEDTRDMYEPRHEYYTHKHASRNISSDQQNHPRGSNIKSPSYHNQPLSPTSHQPEQMFDSKRNRHQAPSSSRHSHQMSSGSEQGFFPRGKGYEYSKGGRYNKFEGGIGGGTGSHSVLRRDE